MEKRKQVDGKEDDLKRKKLRKEGEMKKREKIKGKYILSVNDEREKRMGRKGKRKKRNGDEKANEKEAIGKKKDRKKMKRKR